MKPTEPSGLSDSLSLMQPETREKPTSRLFDNEFPHFVNQCALWEFGEFLRDTWQVRPFSSVPTIDKHEHNDDEDEDDEDERDED